MALHDQKKSSSLPVVQADLNFFSTGKDVLPFLALLFRLGFIVEGPCFITSDDSLQEDLSFFVKLIKEFPGNVEAVFLVLRCEHLRYPATAHLGKFEHFMDYVMNCTCGYVQLLGYFFNSYPPFSKNQVVYCLLFFRCVHL